LSIAYKAYQIAHESSPERELDGYTSEQRLFLSWAVVWQAKVRTEMLLQRLATDPHSPAEFRCNQIVRNLPEFYAAFDVGETDALWLDEEQRVKIW
ncbi:MAG TPA: M13-type metalloendopeptidase, partial [Propionibacteriaceae bacterium]|nr:M13-type metalloendopeptidase [Propionibacteriaceae bacterium]